VPVGTKPIHQLLSGAPQPATAFHPGPAEQPERSPLNATPATTIRARAPTTTCREPVLRPTPSAAGKYRLQSEAMASNR
jgi:hypothetical protein